MSDRAIKPRPSFRVYHRNNFSSKDLSILRASGSPGILAAKTGVKSQNQTLIFQRFAAFMKVLATVIAKELKNAKHCAVYEPELTRVWPDPQRREIEIASFAKKHGWRLRYYSHGFCAIFDKAPLHEPEAATWRF